MRHTRRWIRRGLALGVGALVSACLLAPDPALTDAGAGSDLADGSDGSAAEPSWRGPCRCLRSGSGSAGVVSQSYEDDATKRTATCSRSQGGGCPWREYQGDKTDANCYGFDAGGWGYSSKFRCEKRLEGSGSAM